MLGHLVAGSGVLAAGCDAPDAPARGACPELAGERIRWIVGTRPGGGYDSISRLIEPGLEEVLGAEVTIENVPGAGGLVGSHRLSRARPDGRTVGILTGIGLLLLPCVGADHALDLERDFDVLARLRGERSTFAVGAHLGVRTLEELLRRRTPLVMGQTGPLSVSSFMAALLADLFKVEIRIARGYPAAGPMIGGILRAE